MIKRALVYAGSQGPDHGSGLKKDGFVMIKKPAPVVILVNPQLGENVGTAARAMANFGLRHLHLVEPRDGWPNAKASSAAASARVVVENAVVHDTLDEAIGGLNFVYATTARPRDMVKVIMTPEQAGADMRARAARGEKTGILFGRERWGLNNDEIALCDVVVMAPVDPEFASINIAQAVLLMGYEWYRHEADTLGMGTGELAAQDGPGLHLAGGVPAQKRELIHFFEHLEGELDKTGFFKSAGMRTTMVRNLRNLFQRQPLSDQEVRTLRGVISSLTMVHRRKTERSGKKAAGPPVSGPKDGS